MRRMILNMSSENKELSAFKKELRSLFSKSRKLEEVAVLIKDKLSESDESVSANDLKQRFKKFSEKNTFKEGDIVTWKEGLQDRNLPKENTPAIVVKVLTGDDVVLEESTTITAASPYFRNELDLLVGVISNGRFMISHQISSRFEHYKGK